MSARRVQPDATLGTEQLLMTSGGWPMWPRLAPHPTVARHHASACDSLNDEILGRWAAATDGGAVGNQVTLTAAAGMDLHGMGAATNPLNHSIGLSSYDHNTLTPLMVLANGICITGDPAGTIEQAYDAILGISLCTEPSADVVIDVVSLDTGEGTVSPSQLTFTTTNWSDEQQVTVTAVDDGVPDPDVTYLVTFTVDDALSPNDYDGIIDAAVITNYDFFANHIFSDGFESGNTTAWTAAVN